MKFSCTKENFLQALSLVSSLAGKNVNLPILNNILLKADAQKVEVVGTNLDLAITVVVRAKVEAPGQFTIPARTLVDFINLLTEEKVDIELQDNELLLSAGKSFTKIKGTPADEFPVVPTLEDGQGFVIKAEELKRGLSQVLPAVAKNEIRPELAGIFFSCNTPVENEVVLAATDSYRLAEKKLRLLQGNDPLKTVIPGRTAVEMVHVLSAVSTVGEEENARLLITPNQIALHFNNIQMTSRLINTWADNIRLPSSLKFLPYAPVSVLSTLWSKYLRNNRLSSLGLNLRIRSKSLAVFFFSVSFNLKKSISKWFKNFRLLI
jgi:DNA polymerase-3 subunit beta